MGNMKLNVSYPANGSQKLFEIEDERKLNVFMEKRMGAEVPGDSVGDEFKGYIFRITGGIVGMDMSVLALSIVKKGDEDIPGLTDVVHPKRLGPKRATKIRRFFGLTKDDDVRK